MKEVLILGNGISRLLHEDFIRAWKGELWACNFAYLEWGAKLTRLTGHLNVLTENAIPHREANGHRYEIWVGHIGVPKDEPEYVRHFTCPPEFRKDSGTTLVAQALAEGFEKINICGFDIGGRDIYSVLLHQANKTVWLRRWRELYGRYPREFDAAVEFVGYDHRQTITDTDVDEKCYYRRYVRGKPHLPDPEYIALFNLLYKTEEWYDMRTELRVKVRYIKGTHTGWETEYRFDVAEKLEARGEIEILSKPEPDETAVLGDATITARMSKETLVKIAELRGVEGADELSKKQLIELLQEK